ncbi:MAG: LamG-like jellyroll fold domain-containing protein [Cytophagales bacterium]
MVAAYNFNRGIANGNNAGINTLTDQSGANNTGTLNSFTLNGGTSNWVSSATTITGNYQRFIPGAFYGNVALSPLATFGGAALGTPNGVATLSDGRIIVSSATKNALFLYAQNGLNFTYLSSIGGTGSGLGQFTNPAHIAVNNAGLICVAEPFSNNRVQVLSLNGNNFVPIKFVTNSFSNPFGIAFGPDGRLYVSDDSNNRFHVFSVNGSTFTLATQFGTSGSGLGQFNSPQGLSIGPDNRIYLAEYNNHRLQILTITGNTITPITQFGVTGSAGSASNQLSGTYDAMVDSKGNVFVASYGAHSIRVITVSGASTGYIGQLGTVQGTALNQLNGPVAISFSNDEKLIYIANNNDNRISVWGSCDSQPEIVTQPQSQTICGTSLSSVTLSAVGVGLSYQWSNGSTLATLSTSVPGIYTVTVNGLCGYTFSNPITITSVNCALDFDGTDDFVQLPAATYFNDNTFTIEAWVYPKSSFTDFQRIVDFGNGQNNDNVFLAYSGSSVNTPNFGIYPPATGNLFYSTGISANTWTHIAVAVNGSNGTIYLNGVPSGSATNLFTAANVVRSLNYIGKSNWVANNISNMQIDELRIWSESLSQQDINANRNRKPNGNEPSLLAYYDFNQGLSSGNNTATNILLDKSINGYHGTLTGFSRNGVGSNFITSNSTSSTGVYAFAATSITGISANQTVCSGVTLPLSVTATGSGLAYQWRKDGANIAGATSANVTLTSALTTSAGIYTVAITSLGGNLTSSGISLVVKTQEIHVIGNSTFGIASGDLTPATNDGTDFGTTTLTGIISKTFIISNTGINTLNISNISIGGANATSFRASSTTNSTIVGSGNIVFTIEYSSSIAGISNATINIANDDCDEGNYTFAIRANTTAAGTALDFDGSDDYVSVASLSATPSFTFEAWINIPSITAAYKTLIEFGNDAPYFALQNGFLVMAGVTGDPAQMLINTWTHVAATFDAATSRTSLYKNGILVNTVTTPIPTRNGVGMGIGFNSGDQAFLGKMDEVRIWNRALSASEINVFMSCNPAAGEPNLVARYDFNQGVAGANNAGLVTVADMSGNGNTGVATNFTLNGTTSNWSSDGRNSITCVVATSITGISSNSTVCTGSSIPLSVTATGSGLAYQWRKDGLNIAGATASSLTLTGVTSTSAGIYTVAITSLGGNLTSSGISLGVANCQSALNFTGGTDIVYLPVSSTIPQLDFSKTSRFSVQFWFRKNGLGAGQEVVWSNFSNAPQKGYEVYMNSARPAFAFEGAGTGNLYVFSENSFGDNSWHQVTYLYNGVPDISGVQIYVDGNKQNLILGTYNAISGDFNASSGNYAIGARAANTQRYVGELDNLAIFNTTLTQNQINNTLQTTLTGNEPNLVAFYDFNQSPNPGGDNTGRTKLFNATSVTGIDGDLTFFTLNGATSNWVSSGANNFIAPSIINISENQTACKANEDDKFFNVTALGSGLNYQWYENGVAVGGNNFEYSTTAQSLPTAGTYTYICVISNFLGSVTSPGINFIVNPLPTISIAGNNIICVGNTVTLTALGANTYTWNTAETNQSITVNPNVTTLYSVDGIDLNGCASSSPIFTITVTAQPTVVISGDNSVCVGESTSLTVSGANSYLWSNGATTSSIVLSPASTQIVSVLGIVSVGCEDTEQTTLTINPLPNILISGVTTVCPSTATLLTASGANSYVWSNGSNTLVATYTPVATQTITATGTDLNGCKNSTETILVVNPLPTISIAGNNIICVGNAVTLTALGANTYTWNTASTNQTITVIPNVTTLYSVDGINLNGCASTALFTVTVTSLPTVLISGDNSVCIGEATTLSGSGANSYLWSNGATTSSIVLSPFSTQIVSVLGIISAGCEDTEQTTLTINPLPNIAVAGVTTVCSGTATSLTASGANSYVWSNGSNTSVATYTPFATQTITAIGTDLNGCKNLANAIIEVNTLPALNLSLSPNTLVYGSEFTTAVSSAPVGLTFSLLSGSLPTGISLSTLTGILTGTATGVGNFNFIVSAQNQYCTAQQAYAISVDKAKLSLKPLDITIYERQVIPTSFTSSISGLVNGENVVLNYQTNAIFGSPAGNYNVNIISISGIDVANYTITTLVGTLTILPRIKLTIAGANLSRTYGTPNTLTGVIYFNGTSQIAKEGLNTLLGGDLINLQFTSDATEGTRVGINYLVNVTTLAEGSDLSKYEIVSIISGRLQIRPSRITIRAFDYFVNFGDPIPASFPGTIIGTVLAKDNLIIENTAESSTALGVYLIIPEVTGDSLSNYSFIVFPGNLYVRYGLTVSGNSLSKNYFQPNPILSGSAQGLQAGGQNVTVTWVSAAMTNSPVGNYDINPLVSGSDLNLYYIISTPGVLSVSPIPLTVAANNFVKIAGLPNPAFSATKTGLVNNEDVFVSFFTDADINSTPDSYFIYPSVSGLSLSNYTLITLAGTLFVGSTTSPISIPSGSFTRVYGGSDPDYSIVLQGLKAGDDVQAIYVPSASSLSGVGVYSVGVRITGVDANKYEITTATGTLTVTQATLSIAASNYQREYGNSNQIFTGSVVGLVNNDRFTVNYLTDANQISSVGIYKIRPFLSDLNIDFANYILTTLTGDLNILPVNLTVRGASLTKKYGEQNPQLAYNIFGFVNNENITVLDVLPQAITTATQFSDVDTIDVNYQNAFDRNYTFTYTSGSIIIQKASQTITGSSLNAKVKTGETVILSAKASSDLPISIEILDPSVISANGSVITGIVDGITSIIIKQNGNTNYLPADSVVVSILSTSTGIVSTALFQISGKDTVLMNTSSTYLMPNKPGYTYAWAYTGKNVIVTSRDNNEFELLFTNTSEDGKVIGNVIDELGNILKADTLNVHVIKYTDAEIASDPELQEKITAAILVEQLEPLECEPVVTDCRDAYIINFNLGKRINNKSECSKSGFGDFTSIGKIDSLVMGNSYIMRAISVNNITDASFFAIWIDYGNDGSFEDPDDFIRASFKADTIFELKNVVIRNNDNYIGPRRVRVSMRTTGAFSNAQSSCPQEGTVGETEDYLIYVKKQDAIEAPSLVTPNDDGKNDLFLVKGINPKLDNKLTILDRTGKTVYQKEGYENDWGGTDANGNKVEDGTFFFFFTNGNESIKGFFELRSR